MMNSTDSYCSFVKCIHDVHQMRDILLIKVIEKSTFKWHFYAAGQSCMDKGQGEAHIRILAMKFSSPRPHLVRADKEIYAMIGTTVFLNSQTDIWPCQSGSGMVRQTWLTH